MDATTTIEISMNDPANNFFIEKIYTYGDITEIFILVTICALVFFNLLYKIIKKDV